jgi:hypothetical protein
MKFLLILLPLVLALFVEAAEWHAHYRMTSDEYQSTAEYYVDQGYRIKSVSGYASGTTKITMRRSSKRIPTGSHGSRTTA